VHVNPGSGPEKDETGLPPVDIEIPDDARELDRDVQAYHRELRARRRDLRSMRVHGTLSMDSMVMPLLICCLIFAIISGTLLSLFTATSIDQNGLAGSGPAGPAASTAPGLVATASVSVAGKSRAVDTLGPAILLVVPATGCPAGCTSTISQLAKRARTAHVPAYLVAASSAGAQSARLAGQVGQGVRTASDTSGVLDSSRYRHSGLTAILVSPAGRVSVQQQLTTGSDLSGLVKGF
jgi:hypothetical protein